MLGTHILQSSIYAAVYMPRRLALGISVVVGMLRQEITKLAYRAWFSREMNWCAPDTRESAYWGALLRVRFYRSRSAEPGEIANGAGS